MNFQTYKVDESDSNFYFYVISHVQDPMLVLEEVEHGISNEPQFPMNQYLMSVDFDKVECSKSPINPIDVINESFPQDPKCMNISHEYVALIPPPKVKKQSKPKAEAKEAKEAKPKTQKPRAKKSAQVSIEPAVAN